MIESGSPAGGLDHILAALADPARRQVIDRLRDGPCRAGELAGALGLAPPLMSKHLRVLRLSRLIEEDRLESDARIRLYRLCPEPFAELKEWLESVQALWTDQLDAFKRHIEAKER